MKQLNLIAYFLLILIFIVTPTTNDIIKIILIIIILISGIKSKINKQFKSFYAIMAIIIFFNIIMFIRGYYEYGDLAINDFKIFIIYFLLFSIFQLSISDLNKIKYLDFAIRIATFIINIYTIIFVLSSLSIIPFNITDFLKQEMFFAKGEGFFKIYGLNLVSYSFLTPYIISTKMFFKKNDMNLIKGGKMFNNINFYLTVIATIFTLRRAYILSTLIVMLILFLIIDFNKRKSIIILIIITSIFLVFVYFNPNYYYEIISSFNFTDNKSNIIRSEQLELMINYIKNKIWFGYGYGFHMPELVRNENITSYELQYLKLAATSGIVGIILYFGSYLLFVRNCIKMILKNKNKCLFLFPALAGQLVVIISNTFNPILSQLSALIFLFYPIYVYNIYKGELNK